MDHIRLVPLVVLGTLALIPARTAPAQQATVRIRGVQLVRQGPAAIVIVEATGPLPAPVVGQVDGPPRVFFDFAGVLPATRGVASSGDAVLRGVRVALNSAKPLVTRVVIDLVRQGPFRVDADHIGEGRFRVIIGDDPVSPQPVEPRNVPAAVPKESAPAANEAAPTSGPARRSGPPPSPPAPPPPAPPAAATASATRELDRYLAQIADPLERLLALRSLLATIDQFASPAPDELQMGAEEFDRIRRVVSGVKPPPALQPTHDLLVRACALGTMAARLRAEANRTSDIGQVRNAGSAAAGARLLLERACGELGCDAR